MSLKKACSKGGTSVVNSATVKLVKSNTSVVWVGRSRYRNMGCASFRERHSITQIVMNSNVSQAGVTRRVARTLWHRLTDWKEVREAACQALENVANRLSILDVASHPLQDPFMPARLTSSPAWRKFTWGLPLLVGFGFLDLLKGVLTNLLSDYLGVE